MPEPVSRKEVARRQSWGGIFHISPVEKVIRKGFKNPRCTATDSMKTTVAIVLS
jgi:hypothetical protein